MMMCAGNCRSVRALFVDTRGDGPPPELQGASARLGVHLETADARDLFSREVRTPCEDAYRTGLTPNPCARCNARVKLALAHSILRPGETLVTGHYAVGTEMGLFRARDRSKDQSYFLALVPRNIMARCAFPLGLLTKDSVRSMVRKAGLPFISRESQDLCFAPDRRGEPGPVVTADGKPLGFHRGLGHYTVGQRSGVGAHGRPVYVIRLIPRDNMLVVGEAEDLYSKGCTVAGVNDLEMPREDGFEADVQLRSRHRASRAAVARRGEVCAVDFHSPQKAVAPGQLAVFYRGDQVLGAGTIVGRSADEGP
jgi:tRNA-specific 2-thiouridylase